MADEPRKSLKPQLVVALAQGSSVAAWARANEVPMRTAYRWSKDPKIRKAVEAQRRRLLDRAVHPRCKHLKEAFASYRHDRKGGQGIDFPADGHPEEDLIDALRGGVRDAMPEGSVVKAALPRVHASRVL
jgi:hypothetical protein